MHSPKMSILQPTHPGNGLRPTQISYNKLGITTKLDLGFIYPWLAEGEPGEHPTCTFTSYTMDPHL